VDLANKIEAVLYMYGKPVTIARIRKILKSNEKETEQAISELFLRYEKSTGSLIIIRHKDRLMLTVKEEFSELVKRFVKEIELQKAVVETLAMIALNEPILQSHLSEVRGSGASEHVRELDRMGFVKRTRDGRSYRVELSKKFFEYFDIDKKQLKEKFKNIEQLNEGLLESAGAKDTEGKDQPEEGSNPGNLGKAQEQDAQPEGEPELDEKRRI